MSERELKEEALTRSVIGAFYAAYNALGYGFAEHVCVRALEYELRLRGHRVSREVRVRVMYKGFELCEQRLDMVVDEALIVEVKATEKLHRLAPRQIFNYLNATHFDVGLLLHFGPEPAFYRLISRRAYESALSSVKSGKSVQNPVRGASSVCRRNMHPGRGRIQPDLSRANPPTRSSPGRDP